MCILITPHAPATQVAAGREDPPFTECSSRDGTRDSRADIDVCEHSPMSKSVLPRHQVATETIACCSPLTAEPLDAETAERVSRVLKALADPVRLRLVSLIASHEDGEACVCDLNDAFELSQPTISHHLKVLHAIGLLERSKRGVWVYYRTRPEALADLAQLLGGVTR